MRVLGIVAEYNPFHNGHIYQLKKSIEITKADFVVAVISGNFTQRGELAIFSKWNRAKIAIECGIDLVIEIPFAFACNNAEYFAWGAISILDGLGCVTHLSFGSESGKLQELKEVADFLTNENDDYKFWLKHSLNRGNSYPKARDEAVAKCLGQEAASLIRNPNNILAVEYMKQLNLIKSDIIPVTVKRIGTEYHELQTKDGIASASAIRKILDNEASRVEDIYDFIPSEACGIFSTAFMKQYTIKKINKVEEDYYKLILSKILTMKDTEIGQIFSISEGLENKLKEAAKTSNNLETLIKTIKSKRYTTTRVTRILAHLIVGLTKENFNDIIQEKTIYARILGFNEKGAKLLKYIKKSEKSSVPCITNVNKEINGSEKYCNLLYYDFIATDLYNLLMDLNIYDNSDKVITPYRKL